MADIFISYSSEDKTYVKGIAGMLEQQGWTVWWDRDIPIGQRFDNVIEEELAKAYCVIVIWTKRSVVSEWVKNEANEASQLGKLVPVLLEDVPIPLAFKRTEAALLFNWNGEPDHPELSLLLNAITQTIQKNKEKTGQVTKPFAGKTKQEQRKWKFDTIFSKQSPASGYVTIAIVGFVVSLLTVYYYLRYIQGNVSSEVDQRVFYLILILFGIAASAVIFGIMNSYAALKGEKFDAKFKLAGPVVGVMLTVLGGFYLPHGSGEQNVTIRVFDYRKNPLTQGDVKIYLQDYIRDQSIDKMGQALFAGIPSNILSNKIKIEVSSPGYATKQFDTILNKSGAIELTLPFTTVVFISGAIKTAAEMPIRDVEINVDGTKYFTRSITDGTYSLRLDEYTLGDEITITTSHPNFEDKTVSLKIESPTIRSVNFFLQPVNH
jgi:hypothetical protein